jgi:YegS/Rv2252/BmrU family lipid kinase
VQRATLLINPRAGHGQNLATQLPFLLDLLRHHGIAAEAIETRAPGDAQRLAAQAAASGCDTLFACGGDGTVHETLQGLIGSSTALGVLPLGTANALARNLGLSLDPLQALTQQLQFTPRKISVGEIQSATQPPRFFTVMAGAGPDGMLVYSLLTGQKSALGRLAYYAHAARLFATHRFHPFTVRYRLAGSASWHEVQAVSAICVRVPDLGGAFGRLTPGASLLEDTLRLVLVKPPAGLGLPLWFATCAIGLHALNPWLASLTVDEFHLDGASIHAQVDGEWLGRLPISVNIRRDAVSLLMPPS